MAGVARRQLIVGRSRPVDISANCSVRLAAKPFVGLSDCRVVRRDPRHVRDLDDAPDAVVVAHERRDSTRLGSSRGTGVGSVGIVEHVALGPVEPARAGDVRRVDGEFDAVSQVFRLHGVRQLLRRAGDRHAADVAAVPPVGLRGREVLPDSGVSDQHVAGDGGVARPARQDDRVRWSRRATRLDDVGMRLTDGERRMGDVVGRARSIRGRDVGDEVVTVEVGRRHVKGRRVCTVDRRAVPRCRQVAARPLIGVAGRRPGPGPGGDGQRRAGDVRVAGDHGLHQDRRRADDPGQVRRAGPGARAVGRAHDRVQGVAEIVRGQCVRKVVVAGDRRTVLAGGVASVPLRRNRSRLPGPGAGVGVQRVPDRRPRTGHLGGEGDRHRRATRCADGPRQDDGAHGHRDDDRSQTPHLARIPLSHRRRVADPLPAVNDRSARVRAEGPVPAPIARRERPPPRGSTANPSAAAPASGAQGNSPAPGRSRSRAVDSRSRPSRLPRPRPSG